MKDYFANLPKDKIGEELWQRKEDYYKHLKHSGRLDLYRRIYDQYYRAYRSGGKIYYTGEEGEYTNIDVNDFRNILLHLNVLTTDQEPSFEPRASNTDTKSMAQTILAKGLLDYYLDVKEMQRYMELAGESAIAYGDGYVGLDWNATSGEEYAVDEKGNIIREGDLEGAYYPPIDVIIDPTRPSALNHDWRMTRRFVNKYLIAAKYAPEPDEKKKGKKKEEESQELKMLRDGILDLEGVGEMERESIFHRKKFEAASSDLIPVYTFYHAKNEAIPQGRMVRFVASHLILSDGPLPFEGIPLFRMAPAEQEGTPFGYTIAFDLLPLQEAIDRLCSVVLTNQATFGVGNILIPDGSNLTYSQLADGLNALGWNPKATNGFKPEALNLTNTPAEVFRMIEMLRAIMQTLSGVNSVARGEPESSLKSGSALALVQSMAIKFNSGLQRSYAKLASSVGTGIIKILQDYARSKRVAAIAGKSNRQYMRYWTGKDLDKITRVVVDLGNPLMRTTAGRVNLADTLLGAGKIESGEQYIQVLTTGKLEPLTEGKTSELMNIRAENEALSEGKEVEAVKTDAHALHIQEHKTVLASPEARLDPDILEPTLAHIDKHIALLGTTDPNLLLILGQQPLPPSPEPLPEGTDQGAGDAIAGSVPVGDVGAEEVRAPNMPENPLTGKTFDPNTGGL